jgi:hypothetical protein
MYLCKSPKNKPFSVVDPDLVGSGCCCIARSGSGTRSNLLIYETLQLKVVTNEKGEALAEALTIIC